MNDHRFTTVARNSVWTFTRIAPARFPNSLPIPEQTKSYDKPDINELPPGTSVLLELFGGELKLRLDGDLARISVEQFEWLYFSSESDARNAVEELWLRIFSLEGVAKVRETIQQWIGQQQKLVANLKSNAKRSRS